MSMGFLGWWVITSRASVCLLNRFRGGKLDCKLNINKLYFLDVGYILQCLISPLGALLEPSRRINEYSIFTLPNVLEGFFDLFRKLGYIKKPIPYSREIIFALSMAVFLYLRKYYQDFIPNSYLKILNFIFGNLFLDKKIQETRIESDDETKEK